MTHFANGPQGRTHSSADQPALSEAQRLSQFIPTDPLLAESLPIPSSPSPGSPSPGSPSPRPSRQPQS